MAIGYPVVGEPPHFPELVSTEELAEDAGQGSPSIVRMRLAQARLEDEETRRLSLEARVASLEREAAAKREAFRVELEQREQLLQQQQAELRSVRAAA